MNREKHPILRICAFVHGDALFRVFCCGDCWLEDVAVLPLYGRGDEEIGRSGDVFEERVSFSNQFPFVLSSEPRLRVLPPTDYAKVRMLAQLASSLHQALEENTLVKSLGSTRES